MPFEIDYLTDPLATPPEPALPEYELNTQHAAEAVYNLIDYFKKPRNQAVVEAVASQVQELENALWQIYNAFDLYHATAPAAGHQLELIGKIVGEGRQGRADAEYRTAVRARILVNSSTGTLEELLAIIKAVSPTATIYARELYPATLSLDVSTFGASSLQALYRMLKQAKTAGVRLLLGGPTTHVWGAVDGSPVGFLWGAVDGSPVGGLWSGGT